MEDEALEVPHPDAKSEPPLAKERMASLSEPGEVPPPPEPTSQEEPLDPATVSAWLARTKPAAVLALLKDPELGLAVSRAFLGLRSDAKGYANPLVRSRLAQSALKDVKLAEKLRVLAETEILIQAVPPKPISVQESAVPIPLTSKPDQAEVLRAERDQRRRERDEARQALAHAEIERDEAVRGRQKADAEREEAGRQARRQAERIARLERQVHRKQEIEAHLLRALGEDKISPPPSSPARTAGPALTEAAAKPSPWLTAIYHLLDKSKFDPALALAEDVLKMEGEDAAALDIAGRALEGKRDAGQAAPYVRRLLSLRIAQGELLPAPDTLLRLLRLLPEPREAEAETRRFLAALSPRDRDAIAAAQRMLSRLRAISPESHAWLTDYITSHTALAPVLMPPPGALSPDDPLPFKLALGQTVTARQLVEAIDQGNTVIIDAARALLFSLAAADLETHARVWTALEQASDDEPSRLMPLRRIPRGPVVVDGSNVAWFDQESLVSGKPRLRHLREIRRALRERGFFPVILYADANLPYFIDEPAPLRAMRDRSELTLVDAGTVADEVLLRMAKHLSAPLVTNDKMEDWDPDGEVPKVRYAISMAGEVSLLSEV